MQIDANQCKSMQIDVNQCKLMQINVNWCKMVIWKKQKKVHLVLIVSNTQWMDMKRQDKKAFST